MPDPVIELRGVTKSYGTKVVSEVLHGIDFTVAAGEFTALIGPSGSGKSTLLNILGLLDRPSTGRVFVRGQDTARMNEDELTALRGRALGFVFQFHHLIPALTAAENVMVPLAIERGRIGGRKMRERAELVLRAVGLHDKLDAPASDLSGGQQQRVAIARALALDPPLVLADEPTGNLDTRTSDQAFELMRAFNRERGTAFLIVTHDARLADRCDRVVRLVDGRIDSDEPRSQEGT